RAVRAHRLDDAVGRLRPRGELPRPARPGRAAQAQRIGGQLPEERRDGRLRHALGKVPGTEGPLPLEQMRILELDPDLAPGLDPEARDQATEASDAEVIRLEPGVWKPPTEAEPGHMGMLVTDGLLSRTLQLANRQSVELLTPGDILRPWILLGPTSSVGAAATGAALGQLRDRGVLERDWNDSGLRRGEPPSARAGE